MGRTSCWTHVDLPARVRVRMDVFLRSQQRRNFDWVAFGQATHEGVEVFCNAKGSWSWPFLGQ